MALYYQSEAQVYGQVVYDEYWDGYLFWDQCVEVGVLL